MDLLKSLNLEDELPEQQTRIPTILKEQDPSTVSLKLGFDACCYCGKTFTNQLKMQCKKCKRVLYCSKECRQKDSEPPTEEDYDELQEESPSLGHSTIVCALLALANNDEDVIDEIDDNKEGPNGSKKNTIDEQKREAAIDRIASEYESYPATLANIILEGPCYKTILEKKNMNSNRKKRKSNDGNNLTIHIIGASDDSELWVGHPSQEQEENVFQNYADALSEIADQYHLSEITLTFIGPDCPKNNMDGLVPIQSPMMTSSSKSSSSQLKYQTIRKPYNSKTLTGLDDPDIVVFFNPGFTCPDYDWTETMNTVNAGTPCLITTNTELEGIADAQYLFDNEFILELPTALMGMMIDHDSGHNGDDYNEDNQAFFTLNPYCGLRVRQSGTMANDLYVKNRWIFGGICGSNQQKINVGGGGCSGSAARKKAKIDGSGNTKKKNPALV